jgi:CHAT domain-containing protein/tetratricopeptide (TPR) repeat protein
MAFVAASIALPTAPVQAPQPLLPGAVVHGQLAGGEKALYTIDIPADTAARLVVTQDGIDVGVTLRVKGSDLPLHGLDLVSGPDGDEVAYPPIASQTTTWSVFVSTALPRAVRGGYTIVCDLAPADDHARALAAAYQLHHDASDTSWIGDGAAFQKAVKMYEGAAAAAAAAGDAQLAAEATYQAARLHDQLGDQVGAIALQKQALQMFHALGRRDREARVLDRLGDLSRKIGEVTDSRQYFDQALPLARDVKDPVNEADILNNAGLVLAQMGEHEQAIDQYQAALPLAQEVSSASVETSLMANMAESYGQLGLYDKSIATLERALVVVERLHVQSRTANTTRMMAVALFQGGEHARADEMVRKALGDYETSSDRRGLAAVLHNYGQILYAEGQAGAALEKYAQSLPLMREVHNRWGEGQVLADWAEAQIDRGEYDSAIEKLDQSVTISRGVRDPLGEARALYDRARALSRKNQLADALTSAAEATRLAESSRGRLLKPDFQTSYLSSVEHYFDLQIDLLARQGQTRAAFDVSERGRARTLLEGLAESAAKIRKGIDPQLLAKLRSIQNELNAKESYQVRLVAAEGENGPRATAVDREISSLLERWNGVQAAIKRNSPAYAELQMPEPIDADRLQRGLLDAGTALVEYHLGAERSYAWVVDRQSITARRLPSEPRITSLARRYYTLLSRDTSGLTVAARTKLSAQIAAAGEQLTAMVWTPVAPRVGGKRVVIVADGVLQYIPFAALPQPDGRPLIASHEVIYLPSASVLEELRRRSRPISPAASVAVFADPVFSKTDPRLGGHDVAGRDRGANGYPRLRFSRKEADAIGAASKDVFEALDFRAAKATLLSRDLREYRILHFATHGVLNTEHPELSSLVLSLVGPDAKPIDGFLHLHEIYNMDLDADLVVLSACQTALGKEVHGEGLIGLTRGFMYAGASRVVSSVWNVDDRASALLMSRFYEGMLTRKLTPARALREAQLSLVSDPRWADPHYWAAFGLQGDWR